MEDNSLFYSAIKDATPAMSQYLTFKSQYPGCLLLFRMGDFYELFFEDAQIASSILNIALTHRGKHLNEDVPMCGVPVATLDVYVGRLVKYGQKVAICDQIEDPQEAKKRGYKAVVKRDVTRILTAGTIIEESLLNSNKNNFLMSIVADVCGKTGKVKTVSFAAIDISTEDFFVNTCLYEEFSSILEMYRPKEILIPFRLEKSEFMKFVSSVSDAAVTALPDSKFNPSIEKERLERYFKVKTLDGFGIKLSNEMSSCGAVLEYLLITQRDNFSSLPTPKKTFLCDYLIIDPSTSKSLEITTSCRGEYEYSLLGTIDRTQTPFGSRALAARISMPLVDKNLLEKRMNCVEFFVRNEKLMRLVRDSLGGCPDFERSIGRIKFNKFSPRDVGDIRESFRVIVGLKAVLKGAEVPDEGEYRVEKLKDFYELLNLLDRALIDKLPAASGAIGIIADGYSRQLDELKHLKNHHEELIADLQQKYIAETGIGALKIRNNAILGWYVEVPLSQKSKITGKFMHRQTLVNGARYTTEELISIQSKLTDALEEWSCLERKLYDEIIGEILKFHEDIAYAVKMLSLLDIHTNFAHIALERGYTRPEISSDPILKIEGGKHPVLDLRVKDFTHNDCDLTVDSKICLLTGPNMAGKSTYLRQNALIIILAQIGSYIPAAKAVIGIVDRLFSRIGASDDIARGRSTFMVEMIETATILNQATEKSFVILDEVGRGTSTYDGLSIAWAVIENLYKVNKCRVLFATHYRELTALQDSLENVQCKTLKVQEWNGEVIFYHKIIDGIADKSYGIHVASIAGVPKSVIKRATELLRNFESKEARDSFAFIPEIPEQIEFCYAQDSKIKQKLNAVDINNVSPKNALEILYELKELV
ncbi:MAG: DNA mismatch repair protein MutS [Holosporaceae bacterium]|jgi:DNA mismatch repair protein MutS|nr:DNA mismatch repair protein MutS [Holosporaceae bacterium]